ncbi:hypothetical protein J4E85_008446 [Alternaria conjuncta]|uniref:uncharacterized protein n=1 Tax=Alternaria conjuncta TaxID=181017 RepID=UPI00221EE67E|nr:uncharacterized protein J4E85_008446 [Alternaria conjuncta]KAI4923408.1 hypothetical protein J4E85_008446 [Alternaria conjuncta]
MDEEGYRQYFETLLSIKKKRGFMLTIRVLQKYVRLNVWQRIFDMCRDTVAIFEKEGARVRVQFVYNSFHPRRVPKYDMLPGLRHPESNWREDAVRFFDNATRLCDIHRAYRIENNDDYDPTLHPDDGDTPYETDENIYGDEVDSNDSVELYRQDDRGHQLGALSPPHQYGSDFIQWKNDLLDDLDMEERKGIKDSYDYWADFDPPSWVGVSPEPEYVDGPGYDTVSGSDSEGQNSIT